ncbi:HNH endonuclease [Mycobacteroides abscessus]|uniref:HNH endonuclease n=1 Tax=Mycobacteroides abscessus TaxID=36809 RepID=UPI002104B9A0|nr:HNH endonuclease [Mycobacteroides abscessus]
MPRAPRPCPVPGCPNLIRFTRYCPDHTQAWSGPRTASSQITSQRRWRELVPKILDRDRYRCRIRYEGICTGRATVVDKEQPASRRPDLAFDPKNLRAACQPCNDHKARTEDRG